MGLGGNALQDLLCFLLHFRDVEIGNRAGIEGDGLAGRDDMYQGESAATGACLRDRMRNQILRVRQIRRYQDLLRNHKVAARGDNFIEGFHSEKPPAGESPAAFSMWQ